MILKRGTMEAWAARAEHLSVVLISFVEQTKERVAKNDATPEEIAALPEVARVLFDLINS